MYGALGVLPAGAFDFVYTGIGAICWLPDIDRWAGTVAALLRPGGRLFMRDFHPVLLALGERDDDLLVVDYAYFEQPEPMIWDQEFSYVESDLTIRATTTHLWNHGIGEMLTALIRHGLEITMFEEHDSAPAALVNGQERGDDGEWRLTERRWRLPQTFTVQAVKRAAKRSASTP